MSDWEKLAIIHVAVGIETNVLGLLGGSGSFSEVEALLIIAFLLYLTSIILLILAVAPEGDLKGNKAASICCICFLFSAAICILIAVIIWGVDHDINNSYAATLDVTSLLLAILGGIFLICMLAGVSSGSKTSPDA